MLAMSEMLDPAPVIAAATGRAMNAEKPKTEIPYRAPAGTSSGREIRGAMRTNNIPNAAPVIMWSISPTVAAPGENQNSFPLAACVIEVIIEAGEPVSVEMWKSGVKKPGPDT
jgi:hypothetical protein